MMGIDYRDFPIPKGPARVTDRIARKAELAAQERACRVKVRARDQGRCVIPRCRAASQHLHHLVYRSRGGKWTSANVVSLCVLHHQQVHASLIQIAGNADGKLVFTGDV